MVKFSTALVNSLCFDSNFALRGFTNHTFVLNSCRALLGITKHHNRNLGYE